MDSRAILDHVCASPKDEGVLKLIVLRLPNEQRLTPSQVILSAANGVEGDRWNLKPNPNPLSQISLMNARFLEAIAGDAERMNLAGDNLIVDLDLHESNLPAGTRLRVGPAVIEITDHPHTACVKFERRYGKTARDLADTPEGLALRLRGLFARVIHEGEVRLGDIISKEPSHT
ncbi:MAG: MOSC domain-containing protein [Verrucomicrobiia bacterium]